MPGSRRLHGMMGLAACLVLLVIGVAGSDADAGSITLNRTYGVVEVQRAGASAWIRGTERMRLRSGDKIRTGDDAWCLLELSPQNVIRVMERTRLELQAVSTGTTRVAGRTLFAWRGTGAFDLKLQEGQVVPVLDRFAGSRMNLATPVAVAGVRGTAFSATVELVDGPPGIEAGQVEPTTCNVDLTVYHGAIEVTDLRSPDAGVTFVPAGYSIGFSQVRVPRGGFGAGGQGPGARNGQGPGGQTIGGRGDGMGPAGSAAGSSGRPSVGPGGDGVGSGPGSGGGTSPDGNRMGNAPQMRPGAMAPGASGPGAGLQAGAGAGSAPNGSGAGGLRVTPTAPTGPLAGAVRAIGPNLANGPNVGSRTPIGNRDASGALPNRMRDAALGVVPRVGPRPLPPPPQDGGTYPTSTTTDRTFTDPVDPPR